jgi:hypothetical protein
VSERVHSVEIERIRLTGLDVTPERAERVRGLVEVELQRLLERQTWHEGLASGEVSRLDAATMDVGGSHSDSHLANGLAQSIFRTLRGVE